MPTQKNNTFKTPKTKHLILLWGAFLCLVAAGAQVSIDLGGMISFTLQTLFLGLAYYYLPLRWKSALILTYLAGGIAGLPVFQGGIGWAYFSSSPLGFFVGFMLTIYIPSPSSSKLSATLLYFLHLHTVILLLGVLWLSYYTESASKGLETCLELLPGLFLKSILGMAIVWIINNYLRVFFFKKKGA